MPRVARAALGSMAGDADPLAAPPLGQQFYVYAPSWFADSSHTVDLFIGTVALQGGHYLSVIVVLPLMLSRLVPGARGLLGWPGARLFLTIIVALGQSSFAGFLVMGIVLARLVYGLVAAFRAWVDPCQSSRGRAEFSPEAGS